MGKKVSEKCEICKKVYKYKLVHGMWDIDCEWWSIGETYLFLCSISCWNTARERLADIEKRLK